MHPNIHPSTYLVQKIWSGHFGRISLHQEREGGQNQGSHSSLSSGKTGYAPIRCGLQLEFRFDPLMIASDTDR